MERDDTPPVDDLSYRQAIEELEAIVERIERGDVELEESLAALKRGNALVRRCQSILGTVEQELQEVSPDADESEEGRESAERS